MERWPCWLIVPTITVALLAALAAVNTRASDTAAMQGHVFEAEELRDAASAPNAPLLLIVLGNVYDVSSGRAFYGPDGGYAGFANGTDASRAFLTADFDANATDDIDDLLPGQCLGIDHWRGFYANHSNYTWVGRLHGRFYDHQGRETEAQRHFQACVARGREAQQAAHAAVAAAAVCEESTPVGDRRFQVGTWATFRCESPLVPWRILRDGTNQCVCLHTHAPIEGGWEAATLGMEDDVSLPQRYTGCDAESSTCMMRLR